jgi:hypothetical protein
LLVGVFEDVGPILKQLSPVRAPVIFTLKHND